MSQIRTPLLVVLLLVTCFAHSQVKYGVFNVKDNNRLANFPMQLNGSWQLYVDKMLTTVEDIWTQPPDAYVIVPGVWNGVMAKLKHSPKAACTYRMKISGLKPSFKYAFYIKDSPGTATSIYANGKFVANVGIVCEELKNAKAGRSPVYAEMFSDGSGGLELIFQVSNHNYRKGGIWDAVHFGEAECVYREFCGATGTRFYICANLLVLALYNLVIFFLDKSKRSTLCFSLFVIMAGLRVFVADFSIFSLVFPNVSFSFQYKLEYMSLWAGTIFFAMFCRGELKEFKHWRIAGWIINSVGTVLGFCCLFLPISVANEFVQLLLIYSCATLMFIMVVIIDAMRHHNHKAFILLVDVIILLSSAAADIVITKVRIISPIMIIPYAMMLFAIFQFFCISLEQSKMFAKHKALVEELKELNEACVRFVPREFLRILHVKNLLEDVYLGNHVDVEMSIIFSQMYFEQYEGCSDPEEEDKTKILSDFFRRVSPQIADCRGFVSKFISQGFMALFPGEPEDAIECCESIVKSLEEVNIRRRGENKPLLRIGMGVHYGKMILGMIGEEHRLDDTVISDTVNTASRIESYAAKQKLSVVVSETIVQNTPNTDQRHYHPLGEIRVKGKAMPLLLSEYQV